MKYRNRKTSQVINTNIPIIIGVNSLTCFCLGIT